MATTKEDFKVPGACFECMHLGWFLANEESEVQRCDTCAVFTDDDAALVHALELAYKALNGWGTRGKRFYQVKGAVQVAALKMTEIVDSMRSAKEG